MQTYRQIFRPVISSFCTTQKYSPFGVFFLVVTLYSSCFMYFFIAWDFFKSPVFWGIFFPHSATTGVDVRGRNCRLTVKVVSSFSVEVFFLLLFFYLKKFLPSGFCLKIVLAPSCVTSRRFRKGSLGSSSDPATTEPSGLLQSTARPSTHSRGMVKVHIGRAKTNQMKPGKARPETSQSTL